MRWGRGPHRGSLVSLLVALAVLAISCTRRENRRVLDATPASATTSEALARADAAPDFVEVRPAPGDETAVGEVVDAEDAEPEAEAEVASPPPEPTEPVEDLSAAEAACRAGDLGACLRAANRHAEGLFGQMPDEAKARSLWQRACERKHPEACRRLALRTLGGGRCGSVATRTDAPGTR